MDELIRELFALLKQFIFSDNFVLNPVNFVLNFFLEIFINFVMKKKLQKIAANYFAKYFV